MAASDMLMKQVDHNGSGENIRFGDTFTDDQFRPRDSTFDYLLANPPFGVDWKKQQKEIEREHEKLGFAGRFGAGLPRVNDGALLFLQHMISKFEPVARQSRSTARARPSSSTARPSSPAARAPARATSASGSSRTTGSKPSSPCRSRCSTTPASAPTSGSSPTARRSSAKARSSSSMLAEFYVPMRRSLGDKRRKIGEGPSENEPDQIAEIVKAYGTASETKAAILRDARGNGLKWVTLTNGARKPVPEEEQTVELCCISKVFDKEDFGYRRFTVERPLRLRFQITTDRKSRFLDAVPHLLDDVQAIDKALGREPLLDWNDVKGQFEAELNAEGSTWKKNELKLFRDVFTDPDPYAKPVVRKRRKAAKERHAQIYGWFPACDGKTEALYEADTKLRDFENIPLKENEVDHFTREVLPYVPDAWIDAEKTKIGYEINFNRQFNVYAPPRPLAEINTDLKKAEEEILRLLKEVTE